MEKKKKKPFKQHMYLLFFPHHVLYSRAIKKKWISLFACFWQLSLTKISQRMWMGSFNGINQPDALGDHCQRGKKESSSWKCAMILRFHLLVIVRQTDTEINNCALRIPDSFLQLLKWSNLLPQMAGGPAFETGLGNGNRPRPGSPNRP